MYRTSLITYMSIFCLLAVKCPALLAPPNGIRRGCTGTRTEYYNTVCQFSCNAGFNAIGSPSRKCLDNRTWSGQDFLCQGETNYLFFPTKAITLDGICNLKYRIYFKSPVCLSFSCYLSSSTSPNQWHSTRLRGNNNRVLQYCLSVFL